MKELKFSASKSLDEKMDEIENEEIKMNEVELLEEKNEFWCILNGCGYND